MNRFRLIPLFAAVLAIPVHAAAGDPALAKQGYELIKKYCHRCHGVEFNGSQRFNVMERDILLAKRGDDKNKKNPYVTPGKPDESFLWKRLEKNQMPPEEEAQPTADEKTTIKKWIADGADFPGHEVRPFISERKVLDAIYDHIGKVPREDRHYIRYFTLTHLFNNNKEVTDFDFRLYRAAMSKVANSLSWEPDIVVPQPIDKEGTIFYVDLRKLGWDKLGLWNELLKVYPYGLKYAEHRDEQFRDLALKIYQETGTSLPYIRADWFIATASRPPLYHTMLGLPKYAVELEKKLNVDFERNFRNRRLYRAGFATSGISKQNRMIERHSATYGAYWKSYDFAPAGDKNDLPSYPLGPEFKNNPYPDLAFKHAGGEIIFHLPNGLQGYLLVNNKDERIDEGPVNIVNDSLKTAGTPAVVNGLSCMACHRHGMLPDFKDSIRKGHGVNGEARILVEQFYIEQKEMDKLVKKDGDRFMRSLDEATAVFLKQGEDKDKDISTFPEPIGAISRLYVKDLSPLEVALELGIDKPEKLQAMIQGNRTLRELGLGPLVDGAAINRERWESLKDFNSVFQRAARELDIGTPFRVF